MTSQAKMATGAMVLYNGTVYAELTEITSPAYSVEKVDATSHDSPVKVNIPGQASFGDLTFKANFVNDTAQAALRVLALAKTVGIWRFVYPTSSGLPTYSVPGFVSSYSQAHPLKGAAATMSVTITPTDTVTEVTGAGYALTTGFMTLTPNAGAFTLTSSALAGTTYIYDYSTPQATTASFTMTPVAADGTIYVDGTVVASTVASGAIGYTLASYPTGSIKTVFVVVEKTACKPTIYTFRFTRGAA